MDEFHSPNSPTENEFQSTLHTVPSFAIYNNSDGEFAERIEEALVGSGEFSFGRKRMDSIEEGENEKDGSMGIQSLSVEDGEEDVELEPASPPLYLAAGFGDGAGVGIDGTGFGSDIPASDHLFTPKVQESGDLEEYYKRMVDEHPCHPMFLKEYAKLLQSKGDLNGAEDYFLRATLADPDDAEILMQYAKLVWEHHHDKDRALGYFDLAAQVAPQDSHVLAAYASFLWEIEDDEIKGGKHETQNDMEKQKTELVKPSKEEIGLVSPFSLLATSQEIDAANFATANSNDNSNVEDYFKKMINENPNNPLFLKNYAQFLFQSKRDLQTAEDYYSRAILADPSDGQMISEYAKLVWELHHDRQKALFLLEQAVQATPEDSDVLAAYACFLWETEDGES